MKRPARLSKRFVDGVTKPGRYSDGAGAFGLSLLVRVTRAGGLSKTYQQRFKVENRHRSLGLGAAASMSLAQARELAAENALRLRAARRPSGIDRLVAEVSGVEVEPAAPTFKAVLEEYLKVKRGVWKPGSKTEANERARYDAYALPALADKPITDVGSSHLVDVLVPLWHSKPAVASKLKRSLNAVLDFAVGKEYIKVNPMSPAELALGPQKNGVKHHGAIRWQDAPSAMSYVRTCKAYPAKRLALQMLLLTAVRSGEVRGARWQEIDPEAGTWTVPAERMKGAREHRVPLSPTAQDVLRQAYAIRGGLPGGLIFPAERGGTISDDGLRQLLVRRFPGTTAHGLRSTFRDWAAEQTEYPAEIAEHALAHLEGSATVRSYLRTDYFEKRRGLMDAWADHLNTEAETNGDTQ